MDDEAPPNGGLDARGGRARLPLGSSNALWHPPRFPSRRLACAGRWASRRDLCGARSRHQQLPPADRPADRATASASSTPSPASSGSARASPPRAASARRRLRARSRRCRSAATRCSARGVVRARLIATEACRAAENGEAFRSPRRRAGRPRARDHRFGDRGAAGGDRLHRAVRSGGVGRHPVRYRRRLVGAGAARPPGRRPARAAEAGHRRLGVAAARRRHAGRTLRRHRGFAGDLRGHGAKRSRASSRNSPRLILATATVFTCSAPRAR